MNGDFNWVANFIWSIADDVLRDLYVRGKYRDVILPMTVLRRLDAVLEPTKKAVLDAKSHLDKAKITNQDAALRAAISESNPATLEGRCARDPDREIPRSAGMSARSAMAVRGVGSCTWRPSTRRP